MNERILAVRGDGIGDVLLAEPALRALAGDADVTLVCSSAGQAATEVITSVSRTLVFDIPWLVSESSGIDALATHRFVESIREVGAQRAVIFTSQRQPVLPTALLLRLAGVPAIAARSLDNAGPLLDVRLSHDPPDHEVERNLELVEALGLPAPFDRRIRVRSGSPPLPIPDGSVVVHPGASAPSRTPSPALWREVIARLSAEGHPVVLTGAANDRAATTLRSAPGVTLDLVGSTTLSELAGVLASSSAVCIGNTGPMQLAAAVGTPVVAAFPATVPSRRWHPWMVEHEMLGDDTLPCAPCFRRRCVERRQPCAPIEAADIVAAVGRLCRISVGAT
jgi:ADP-heptose:LPS heptosyltransferase